VSYNYYFYLKKELKIFKNNIFFQKKNKKKKLKIWGWLWPPPSSWFGGGEPTHAQSATPKEILGVAETTPKIYCSSTVNYHEFLFSL
jgi:hypothetical protein